MTREDSPISWFSLVSLLAATALLTPPQSPLLNVQVFGKKNTDKANSSTASELSLKSLSTRYVKICFRKVQQNRDILHFQRIN